VPIINRSAAANPRHFLELSCTGDILKRNLKLYGASLPRLDDVDAEEGDLAGSSRLGIVGLVEDFLFTLVRTRHKIASLLEETSVESAGFGLHLEGTSS
jgi:hypothetical protein